MNQARREARTAAHYAQLAADYAARANAHANERYRLECLDWLTPCRRILDVGCGTTNLLVALQRDLRAAVCGVDASSAMLAGGSGRGYVAAARAEQLPFGDHAFDGVVSINLLEHIAEPGRVLREIARVLQSGGRLALATPAAEWSGLLDWAERFRLKLPEGPYRFLTQAELIESARRAGLSPVMCRRILSMPIGGKRWARPARDLERGIPSVGSIHWLTAERSAIAE